MISSYVIAALHAAPKYKLTEAYTNKHMGYVTGASSLDISRIAEARFRAGEMPEVYLETDGAILKLQEMPKQRDEVVALCTHGVCYCPCHTHMLGDASTHMAHCTPCCQGLCPKCLKPRSFELADERVE